METYKNMVLRIIDKDSEKIADTFLEKLIKSVEEFIKEDDERSIRPFVRAIDFNVSTEYKINKLQFRYIILMLDSYGWKHTETFSKEAMTLRIYI